MVVCYIIFTSPKTGIASGACLVHHDHDLAAGAMMQGGRPSECIWIVPGTIDPMED